MSTRYAVNNVNNYTRYTAEVEENGRRRNATLKTSTAFIDLEYPELIFLIPKNISRMCKHIIMDDIPASVYMKKDQGGVGLGSTWAMELETGSQLKLKHRRGRDSVELIVCVEAIHMTKSGRQADIILKMIDVQGEADLVVV